MRNWSSKFITESETLNAFEATFEKNDEGVKYLFLDMDGTVRHAVPTPNEGARAPITKEEVSVFHGLGQKIKEFMNNGWTVIGTSNQRGGLRRRDFVPDFMRDQATLEDAAIGCAKVMEETVKQLGVNFPVYFASDASIYVSNAGNVSLVKDGIGTEDKKGGKAGKPTAAMGEAIFQKFGAPDLKKSFMIGDDHESADSGFAKSIGFKFINPGHLGKDFISFTDQYFGEEGYDIVDEN